MHPAKARWLKRAGEEPYNLKDLFASTIRVLDAALDSTGKNIADNWCVGLKWDVRYSPAVSNTHACPLSGKTNFGGQKDNVPRGYAGFTGRVWVRYHTENPSFGSDPFHSTLTHTGAGGFGSYDGPWSQISKSYFHAPKHLKMMMQEPQVFSWDYRFFIDDFPKLKRHVEKLETIAIINNRDLVVWDEQIWEDPDQLVEDQTFLDMIKG